MGIRTASITDAAKQLQKNLDGKGTVGIGVRGGKPVLFIYVRHKVRLGAFGYDSFKGYPVVWRKTGRVQTAGVR